MRRTNCLEIGIEPGRGRHLVLTSMLRRVTLGMMTLMGMTLLLMVSLHGLLLLRETQVHVGTGAQVGQAVHGVAVVTAAMVTARAAVATHVHAALH